MRICKKTYLFAKLDGKIHQLIMIKHLGHVFLFFSKR